MGWGRALYGASGRAIYSAANRAIYGNLLPLEATATLFRRYGSSEGLEYTPPDVPVDSYPELMDDAGVDMEYNGTWEDFGGLGPTFSYIRGYVSLEPDPDRAVGRNNTIAARINTTQMAGQRLRKVRLDFSLVPDLDDFPDTKLGVWAYASSEDEPPADLGDLAAGEYVEVELALGANDVTFTGEVVMGSYLYLVLMVLPWNQYNASSGSFHPVAKLAAVNSQHDVAAVSVWV